jgi:hypothetical protein
MQKSPPEVEAEVWLAEAIQVGIIKQVSKRVILHVREACAGQNAA